MSLHRDQFITATGALWDRFGETVTFDSAPADAGSSGSSSSITAIGRDSTNVGDSSPEEAQGKRWVVRASEATPKRGDTITDAAGRKWYVFDVATDRGGFFRCETRSQHAR